MYPDANPCAYYWMKLCWFLPITCLLFVQKCAFSTVQGEENNSKGIFHFIIVTMTQARLAKHNFHICKIFPSFKSVKLLLSSRLPSYNSLLEVLWNTEKRVEKEIKVASYDHFISSLYIKSRGVIQRTTDWQDPHILNFACRAYITFPVDLANLIGFSENAMFDMKFIENQFHPHICFYIVLAVEEWRKLQLYLPSIDPELSKEFLGNVANGTLIGNKLKSIRQILGLITFRHTGENGAKSGQNNLLNDHVHSFCNLMFIFHLLEYARHFLQVKELLSTQNLDLADRFFILSEWEELHRFYLTLTSLNLDPNTKVIASIQVSCLTLEGSNLRVIPNCPLEDTISEIKFEQVYTKARGSMRPAAYRGTDDRIILAIYNSTRPKNLKIFAQAFLENLVVQLNKGPVPLINLVKDYQ